LNGRESTAVLNADESARRGVWRVAPGRVLTYGIEQPAFFTAEAIEDAGRSAREFD